jgi:hypothetical protein
MKSILKKVCLFLALSLVAIAPTFAGTLTDSDEGIRNFSRNGRYFIEYRVTLTQIDADPSDDSFVISDEYFKYLVGGVIYGIGVVSASADADVNVTLNDSYGFELFDEDFTQASLPYWQNGDTTLGQLPSIIGTSLTIATDTDWTTAASGDSIQIIIIVAQKDNLR